MPHESSIIITATGIGTAIGTAIGTVGTAIAGRFAGIVIVTEGPSAERNQLSGCTRSAERQ